MDKYLVYLERYNVMVCLSCQYGLIPSGIIRHFNDHHRQNVSPTMREVVAAEAQSYNLVAPQDIISPEGILALPCLKLVDGYECIRCEELAGTRLSMEKHGRLAHKWTKGESIIWKQCKLQTFFAKPNIRYIL